MVKNAGKRKPAAGAQAKKPKARPTRGGLDAAAKRYARLVNDPCYADLSLPTYAAAGTGLLMRVESDFILGAEATSVGAAVVFTPGLNSVTAGSRSVTIPTTVVNADTATITWVDAPTSSCPGGGMASIMTQCRAVAACLQISFVGSELQRAGVVSLSQSTYQTATSMSTTAQIRANSERVVRMPDGVLEIKLAPTDLNANFAPAAALAAPDKYMMPCLVASVTGIPSSTGVRVRCVQVLEWTPAASDGVVMSTKSADSDSTLAGIIRFLQTARPDWQYELITGLGAYAAKAITWI